MTPRPPDLGETALSPAEAAYLHHDHDLWTTPNNTATNVNAALGWHASELDDLEQPKKVQTC